MNLQTCRRHPGPRFLRTCPGCAQELYDIEAANRRQGAARTLAQQIPAGFLPGPIQTVIPAGAGAVIVCPTPGGDWGEFEVMAIRPRTEVEISQDIPEWPADELDQIPRVAFVTSGSVRSTSEIDGAVAYATAHLAEVLTRLADQLPAAA